MKLPRREFLHLAAGATALPAVARRATAQAYPSRPVRIIVGFAAAGFGDVIARLMGQWLQERIGQPFVIENRPGAGGNVATELFKAMAGVDLVHVPYRGNPLPNLLAGQVQLYFNAIASSLEFVRAGQLRVLAVTSATRSELLPDIPAIGEFVPGYEASAWQGIGAPRDTPAEIVSKLNREINLVLADPNVKTRLAGLGAVPMPMTPADFGRLIAEETEK
jgi:tripartite-type tricarboxylate transporter receptor subunit TctC